MAKEKAKHDGLLCFLLALIVVLILVIGGGAYYFLVVDNGEEIAEKNSNINTTNTTNNNSTVFTENQVKTALSNYLELRAHANCDGLLWNLKEKGKLNYDASKDIILNDGPIITSIKFSDYKNAMLNYVSESEFERNWNSAQNFEENSDGYLTKLMGGGELRVFTVKSITKINDLTYSAKTTSEMEFGGLYFEEENFTFTITSYNGNCVIDSLK